MKNPESPKGIENTKTNSTRKAIFLALGILCIGPCCGPIPVRPPVAVCEPKIDRGWLDTTEGKQGLLNHALELLPALAPNPIPIESGGPIYKGILMYRGLEFSVKMYVQLKDTQNGFSGSSMNIQVKEAGFIDDIKLFVRAKGVEL